ncbi:MAG: TRAP transporter substrate-binding protein [Deltaproteobacteria bacterium]|nr:TRAP transporter substrate-binding protein [Deltaproteobacteria bacterium]
MKKLFIVLLSVWLATFILAGSPAGVFAQKVLKLGETHPQDYPTTKGDYEFARLVKERSNGKMVVEVYHNKQLGEEKAVIEQVQLGAIDFTRVSISPVSAFVRDLDAFQLPYLYRDATHMWKVLNGPIGQEIFKKLEASNFIGLGWFEAGSRNFYTKKQVKTVADLKGMKIRVQQAPLMVGLVEALGAVATPLAFGEVYSALQTGVIDGAENNWPSYLSTSHYEVAKFFITDEHTRVPEIMIASKKVFDKLSKEEQTTIKKAMQDAQPYQIKLWNEFEKVAEKTVREKGNTITEVTSQEKQKFMDAMKPLYDKQPPEIIAVVNRIRAVK